MRTIWDWTQRVGGIAIVAFILIGLVRALFGGPEKLTATSPAKSDEDPFTVQCNTTYSLNDKSSILKFKITIDPRIGNYYQFDWQGYSSRDDGKYDLDKRHFAMNDKIVNISSIDTTHIEANLATIDRRTGKFSFSSVVDGVCKKIAYIPIPTKAF